MPLCYVMLMIKLIVAQGVVIENDCQKYRSSVLMIVPLNYVFKFFFHLLRKPLIVVEFDWKDCYLNIPLIFSSCYLFIIEHWRDLWVYVSLQCCSILALFVLKCLNLMNVFNNAIFRREMNLWNWHQSNSRSWPISRTCRTPWNTTSPVTSGFRKHQRNGNASWVSARQYR